MNVVHLRYVHTKGPTPREAVLTGGGESSTAWVSSSSLGDSVRAQGPFLCCRARSEGLQETVFPNRSQPGNRLHTCFQDKSRGSRGLDCTLVTHSSSYLYLVPGAATWASWLALSGGKTNLSSPASWSKEPTDVGPGLPGHWETWCLLL